MKLLGQLKKYCGGEREIQVFRELTKKFEEHIGNNVNEVLDFFEGREILGEITLVIKGINKEIQNSELNKHILKEELSDLIDAGLSLSAASKYLAKKNNISKNLIYKLH